MIIDKLEIVVASQESLLICYFQQSDLLLALYPESSVMMQFFVSFEALYA